ncbi:aminomethyl-transferring glycine dehydrogenase [Leeia aquatica]|uniref:Glycine dehydrogenase (decarboxylating) n=1 Tax=Leeia aquatica TaxID=2725557 RepID=A0A847S939_9NEIS|nr:aminomethyl-transferring glycine dehydrogenase [Leeia aquatica]NLR76283.1 aminomethyl-transferring glycine dehydrogenase [Leeia aquatica]
MTTPRRSLAELEQHNDFQRRHIGPSRADQAKMLAELGYSSLDSLMDAIVPASIRRTEPMPLPGAKTEPEALAELRGLAEQNQVFKSYIGMGYYGSHTPGVILRNILENPAWYTAYTPYQPEISQGRLEAILNFQTMISDLTGMDIANASMLDEGTAAAEAMTLALRVGKSKSNVFYVADDVLPQTLDVIQTRAAPLGIEVRICTGDEALENDSFAVLLQYPGVNGDVRDYADWVQRYKARGGMVIVAADLLALTLLAAPGQWGADVAVGNSQRFGVPMGFGGPHAGYMATRDEFKRQMPGRLVGVSVDSHGKPAYRLALQTREQHIRREKATSNICTAQVLLAVIASMYAVYHGPKGLKTIAQRTHRLAGTFAAGLKSLGLGLSNATFFDTVTVQTGNRTASIHAAAAAARINLRVVDDAHIGVSFDETTTRADVQTLWGLFAAAGSSLPDFDRVEADVTDAFPASLLRQGSYLDHPVFHQYHSETEMLRYLRYLADKDIALDRAMIPLGSCTMKLNATSEMIPVTWPEFGQIHPFAPASQTQGYRSMIKQLEDMLCAATGYAAVSLQPNAGSQGEYAGLQIIQAYHRSRGEGHRNICLIPSSAHGTNPASAQMVDMQVVVVKCDENGNVDVADLRAKAEQHSANLAAIMITYPSTHGVFEQGVREICDIIHQHGGQVYVDGANMNALVGLAAPGHFGGDVSHLNLHKTFCIPHGGGGPGVGPVAVGAHLARFLPGHRVLENGEQQIGAVSAAPFGSASILPISWTYIALMGGDGLKYATESAILSANYLARKLSPHFPVLYSGPGGLVAHECIIDLRPLKDSSGISVDDVAKRLMDFGFHAPTMSFPVAGTLMIEPTESESLEELDRFIEAMVTIREEIRAVEEGRLSLQDNPLVHAPHTAQTVLANEWNHAYPREQAAYPVAGLRQRKYWPPVGRVDNVYGDRNLFCSCIPMDAYQ